MIPFISFHSISLSCFFLFLHFFLSFLVCMFGASLGGFSRSYISQVCVCVLIYIFVRCASARVMSWYAIRGAMECKEGIDL
jgi:hypothetical protein